MRSTVIGFSFTDMTYSCFSVGRGVAVVSLIIQGLAANQSFLLIFLDLLNVNNFYFFFCHSAVCKYVNSHVNQYTHPLPISF